MKNHKHNTEIDKKRTPKHTRRFRELYSDPFKGPIKHIGPCPPIYQRTLTTVGGSRPFRARSHGGRRSHSIPIAPITALSYKLAKAIESMAAASTNIMSSLIPKSRRELKRNT